MYPGKRGGLVEPKGYIYYFGNVVLLLKYVQKLMGLIYLGYLSIYTLWICPLEQKLIKHRVMYCEMMGVKLLSAVDSQVL